MTRLWRKTPVVSTFLTSKLGEELDACEDVVLCRRQSDGTRIALSDGATTASFSAQWAWTLARWFTGRKLHPDPDGFMRILPGLGRSWLRNVMTRDLPWHAEEKVRSGSFATFLGVTVAGDSWRALAVGDSCLFHVRNDSLVYSFPYGASSEFSASPILASTSNVSHEMVASAVRSADGELKKRDLLVLATDGLAQWLMREVENGNRPWRIFRENERALRDLVDCERTERRMRNDDVACAWLRA